MSLLTKEQEAFEDYDLDTEYETIKKECVDELDKCIANRSKTQLVMKAVNRKIALFQHKCREMGEQDLVYKSRAFLKSLNTMSWALNSRAGNGGGGF